jgi:stress response protein YsnF
MTNEIIPPDSSLLEVREEQIIRLLAERLVVNQNKRKVGDVTIRKEVETRMIQVPVRREKLIVEQISPEYKGKRNCQNLIGVK